MIISVHSSLANQSTFNERRWWWLYIQSHCQGIDLKSWGRFGSSFVSAGNLLFCNCCWLTRVTCTWVNNWLVLTSAGKPGTGQLCSDFWDPSRALDCQTTFGPWSVMVTATIWIDQRLVPLPWKHFRSFLDLKTESSSGLALGSAL